jgi:tetratricopeptide (TPR) repeat protein
MMHQRVRWAACLLLVFAAADPLRASPHIPASEDEVLAIVPAGARHTSEAARTQSAARIDVALPLAQFYIGEARVTGDQRFLGYAEGVLVPWLAHTPVAPETLVLHATILQSRHDFTQALGEIDRALAMKSDDAQGWLIRAIIERVIGQYEAAAASCNHLAGLTEPAVVTLCRAGLDALTGHLRDAYSTVAAAPVFRTLPPQARAWRYSELGEMAERLGDDAAAERWFKQGLSIAPADFYMRGAYADVLLRQHRAAETLVLLRGYEPFEPLLLRIASAHKILNDQEQSHSRDLLASAFALEEARHEGIHRREEARFWLDIENRPDLALQAAIKNWAVQREPDDIALLMRAAAAARDPRAAAPALEFIRAHRLEDARLARDGAAS